MTITVAGWQQRVSVLHHKHWYVQCKQGISREVIKLVSILLCIRYMSNCPLARSHAQTNNQHGLQALQLLHHFGFLRSVLLFSNAFNLLSDSALTRHPFALPPFSTSM